jgi:hypothetical protein
MTDMTVRVDASFRRERSLLNRRRTSGTLATVVMSRSVPTAVLAVGLALVFAAPASAGTVSFQDGVFR